MSAPGAFQHSGPARNDRRVIADDPRIPDIPGVPVAHEMNPDAQFQPEPLYQPQFHPQYEPQFTHYQQQQLPFQQQQQNFNNYQYLPQGQQSYQTQNGPQYQQNGPQYQQYDQQGNMLQYEQHPNQQPIEGQINNHHQQTQQTEQTQNRGGEPPANLPNLKALGPYPCWLDDVPISQGGIRAIFEDITVKFGFQRSSMENMYDHLMVQLDSRASRLMPAEALVSLHASYIGGQHANYRKWFFAAQLDLDEEIGFSNMKLKGKAKRRNKQMAKKNNVNMKEHRDKAQQDEIAFMEKNAKIEYSPEQTERNLDLQAAGFKWKSKMNALTPHEKIEQIALYLLLWGEANQVRYLPECLCFIYKCAYDYFKSPLCQSGPPLEEFHYLNNIVTPLYNYIRDQMYTVDASGKLVRKEKDHKDIIGYDDVNQLFWYPEGIERIKLNDTEERLVDIKLEERYLKLANANWKKAFYKTYKEKRTWLHLATNFNRIWVIHLSSFWFFTTFNSPTLYTHDYNQLLDNPPTPQSRWSAIALGGGVACLVQIIATLAEWSFVPRQWPGAQHLTKRLLFLIFMTIINVGPSVYTFGFFDLETHSNSAYIASIVQFTIAIITFIYFSVQPLGSLLGGYSMKSRRNVAARTFTAAFPKITGRSRWFSGLLWVTIFTAKFVESYFFLTLSLRDPIRVLSIMEMTRCHGDKLIGSLLCRQQPRITLGLIYLTDLILFFLDTYLWYIVCNCLFSVGLSFSLGISIMSPWRNVYSRLPKRIYSKLLATSEMEIKYKPKLLVSQIWNAIIISMYREHILPIEMVSRLLYHQIVSDTTSKRSLRSPSFFIAHDDSTFKSKEFFPPKSEAARRISFFAQSVSTPIPEPTLVQSMPIFTVLIPHYGEKIILSLKEIIREDNANSRITLMEYLKQLYPTEWDCFVKDTKLLATNNGSLPDTYVKYDLTNRWKNDLGGPLDYRVDEDEEDEDPKTKTDTNEEIVEIDGVEDDESDEIDDEMDGIQDPRVKRKGIRFRRSKAVPTTPEDDILQGRINDLPFYCIGFKTSSPEFILRTRIWASLRTQTLYRTASGFTNYVRALKLLYRVETPDLVQYYGPDQVGLEQDLEAMAQRKYKLVIAMQRYARFTKEEKDDTEFLLRAYPDIKISYLLEEIDESHPQRHKTFYSCMIDGFSDKDENGDRIPRYKVKLSGNPILGDGKSDNQNHSIIFYRGEYIQVVDANQDNYLEECIKIRSVLAEFEEMDIDNTPPYVPGILYKNDLDPVAIVGAREYIFSENIGVLGDIAAGKEQTFGTLFARTLAEIGGKLHYGHPDFLNGIFMTTRGGISKAQKGLHLNEDIYAGMNALIRGGRIKHSDYYQCGKGRDLGFGSILNFTTKIGAGMGEQILSREYYYLGTQLPIDRFLSFYYAHAGFHVNNLFIVLSVQLFMIVLVNLGALAHESTICEYDKDIPFTDLQVPLGCYNLQPVLDWVTIFVLSVFIVFFIAFVPLLVQELTERGAWRAVSRFFHHLASLSPFFEVFVCQIYATSLIVDITFGGARYISTGRGFAVSRIHFSYLYSKFASSSIYSGTKLFLMLLFATVSIWQPALLWFWITLVSMCLAPFIFNPHQFAFADFFVDYKDFIHWLSKGNRKWHSNSWVNHVKQSRIRYTGLKKKVIGHNSESSSGELKKSHLYNTFLTELLLPFIQSVFLFFAYTFINAQNGVRNVEATNSVLRLIILVFAPILINSVTLVLIFALSCLIGPLMTALCCFRGISNFFAALAHVISVFVHLLMFEVIWLSEGWNFARTLVTILCIISIQNFLLKSITIILLPREFKNDKASRAWWSGNWYTTKVGWQFVLQPLREYLVKIIEMTLFSVDFIIGHCLLFVQTPFIFIPFIDRWHSMVLFWLRPSKQLRPGVLKKSEQRRKRRTVIRYFILYFIVLLFFLAIVLVPALTHRFMRDLSDLFEGTMASGLIQPNNQDNDDTGDNAPSTITTTTPAMPTFKTVW
ncbi:1,3-beta-glucan synthase [Wickerhamomyces ciferrii]|uniref:1,3-beta-glucan synthase n=1 Tax=Wickerhamomyces ciferrii (strain ATCC 14091 / BCRC 22168 / CBS 111 / JCM 3599 / NBRC 0793 / NRRL Y-1031 F-60-10) TaxID=1206466 RepID=K0KXK3_WICCF|nr:1,3-beta-glucan synthase [Wickerhamomyces ciferrii]CCH46214.1 1,3-beta-glucan synthase [Wickerhamomyces ciferrii]